MRFLIATSGRADASPVRPVMDELERRGHEVHTVCISNGGIVHSGEGMNYHLCILLGDRWEMLNMATAMTVGGIPIAHIHGGERTFGSVDNQIRDAITKLSHVHFVAHQKAADRLIYRLDEKKNRVFIVGAPGLDNVAWVMRRPQPKKTREVLLTWHPPTAEKDVTTGLRNIITALRRYDDLDIIWTGVNTDPGHEEIRDVMQEVGIQETKLSADEYLERARAALFLIGNSSSSIIESPALRVPAIDVGTRQDGRLRGPSVIWCDENIVSSISSAINRALNYVGPWDNPYGGACASKRIVDIIESLDIDWVGRK